MTFFPFGETVTRVRAEHDKYGDPIEPANEDDITGVAIWPLGSSGNRSTSESLDRSDEVSTDIAIFVPPGTDVQPDDQFRVRGDLYDVDERASDYRSPLTGTQPGLEVLLVRHEGNS